jgi:hypothetical protein
VSEWPDRRQADKIARVRLLRLGIGPAEGPFARLGVFGIAAHEFSRDHVAAIDGLTAIDVLLPRPAGLGRIVKQQHDGQGKDRSHPTSP